MTVIKYLLRVLKKMIESNHLQLQFLLCLAHKFAFYLKLSLLMKQIPRIIKELILLLLIMPLISFNLQLLDCLIAVWPSLWFILKMIQICILNHNKGKLLLHFSNLKHLYPYPQYPHRPLGDSISRIWISATCICLWNTDEKTLICTTIKQLLSPSGTSKNCTFLLKYRKILFTIGTLTYSAR